MFCILTNTYNAKAVGLTNVLFKITHHHVVQDRRKLIKIGCDTEYSFRSVVTFAPRYELIYTLVYLIAEQDVLSKQALNSKIHPARFLLSAY